MKSIFKYTLILFLLIGCFTSQLHADENTSRFQEGNQLFQKKEYQAALNIYQAILSSGYENGPLYYNIGNCYYKLNDIGHAILNYERALKFMPNDDDLKNNLAITQLNIVDQITPRPTFILFRIVSGILFFFPKPILLILLAIFYIISMGALILWLTNRNINFRQWGSKISLLSGILCIVTALLLLGQWQNEKNRVEGIIMVPSVEVKGSPNDSGVDVFTLHTGTKVRLDQQTADWTEIILEDGKVGWVKKDILEII